MPKNYACDIEDNALLTPSTNNNKQILMTTWNDDDDYEI